MSLICTLGFPACAEDQTQSGERGALSLIFLTTGGMSNESGTAEPHAA